MGDGVRPGTAGSTPGARTADRIWRELSGSASDTLPRPASRVPLSARTDVSELALAAVSVASHAAAQLAGASTVPPDPDRIAVAFTSERHLLVGADPPDVWAALSGFWPTADGWVRTHGNYPHHAAALRRALELPDHADAARLAEVLAHRCARDASRRVERAGGLCTPVQTENPAVDAELRSSPVVETGRLGEAARRPGAGAGAHAPLRGIRVLDLTRVIAGPVATRTLALLGAEVLRLDPVAMPEMPWQHLDTGHGKRTARLSAASPRGRARLHALIDGADVVVSGYRPTAAARLGLEPHRLAADHPGLIVGRLSAWGFDETDLDRRGFDSLVQASSGIAWVESEGTGRPGALPAQALDHTAGYLLAAAVMTLLIRQREDGGSWLAQVSLRRIAAELLGMVRTADPQPQPHVDPTGHLQTFDVDGTCVTTAAPAIAYAGAPTAFAAPRPWGRDEPVWQDGEPA